MSYYQSALFFSQCYASYFFLIFAHLRSVGVGVLDWDSGVFGVGTLCIKIEK